MARHIQLGDAATRPQPHRPTADRMLWLDWATGIGLDFEGRPIEPIMDSRRKKVRLVDLLETARRYQMDMIMLCGKEPDGWSWLVPPASLGEGPEAAEKFLPGWDDAGSYLSSPSRGRFVHRDTGAKVQVMLASEWLTRECPPHLALWTYDRVTEVVATAIERPDWALMRSPGATGLNIWKLRAPASYDMAPMDPTIGALIQATDPQHRIESFLSTDRCDCGDCIPLITAQQLPGFTYADRRFAFHAIPKELGAAPAHMLNADEAADLQHREPYWPARYKIRFTLADWWDHAGPFPVQHTDGIGWHYPNRAGCTHETWVDSDELREALKQSMGGIHVEFLEGIRLSKVNSFDAFVNVTSKMLELCDKLVEGGQPVSPMGKKAVADVIKHIYRSTIGALARRPRMTTHFTHDPATVPSGAQEIVFAHGGYSYKTMTKTSPRDWETWHPEIAARIWGSSRSRLFNMPVSKAYTDAHTHVRADGSIDKPVFGILQLEPEELIGIQGDAFYTTVPLEWTLPESHGGGDDGRDGRLRIKGYLPGPLPTPANRTERQILSNRAEHEGWEGRLP